MNRGFAKASLRRLRGLDKPSLFMLSGMQADGERMASSNLGLKNVGEPKNNQTGHFIC